MNRIRIPWLSLALAGTLAAGGFAVHADEPPSVSIPGPLNHQNGVALGGYDPVAYFTAGKPVEGSKKFTVKHEGFTYRFANAANRKAFTADPKKYLPAYGGFCAFGTANGYKAAIDPAAFSIVEGRLYLNYNAEVKKEWSKDVPGFIAKAEKNWPEVAKTEKTYR